jgi:hypothetical protein
LLFYIFKMVQSELNFSYTMIPAKKYGSLNDEKQWTGLVGMVSNNEVDFGINDLTIVLSRSQVNMLRQEPVGIIIRDSINYKYPPQLIVSGRVKIR